jgi:hypothetical protein
VTADEVRDQVRKMVENDLRHFAKIIDVSGSSIDMDRAEVERMAVSLRGEPGGAPSPSSSIPSARALPSFFPRRRRSTGR